MLVQCPSCQTTYRVAEDVLKKSKPTFRCSRCKNIFSLGGRGAGRHEPPETRSARREDAGELSFSFPPREPDETAGEKISHILEPAARNGPALDEQPSFVMESERESWAIPPERSGKDKTFTLADSSSAAEFDKPAEPHFEFKREAAAARVEDDQVRLKETAAPAAGRPLSVTSYLLLCAFVGFVFSAITLLYQAKPEPVEGLLKAVPWIGPSLAKNDYLRQGIVLQTTRPRFQRIQGNREVFLLSGVAVNRNRVKVREVKIEGYIFGADGKVIERQEITVGNAISAKIVRDLTEQEIKDLQRQGPVKRFEILPDESAPFSIVFLKSGADFKSFGYRVRSADES